MAGNERIREYTLHEVIGHGGMGVIYRATHEHVDREFAVKVLKLVKGTRALQRTERDRLLREASVLLEFNHPHIVRAFLPFEEGGVVYLPLELLRGETLAERLAYETDHRLPTWTAVDFARHAALGLGAVHARGIVHRDVKPSNLFLAESAAGTQLKLIDFGLGKSEEFPTVTLGDTAGTPAYMAPEILNGSGEPAPAGDVYALGLVLFASLAGRLPFERRERPGDMENEVKAVHRKGLPRLSSFVPVPRELDDLVAACLHADPVARPRNGAEEVADRLARVTAAAEDERSHGPRATAPRGVRPVMVRSGPASPPRGRATRKDPGGPSSWADSTDLGPPRRGGAPSTGAGALPRQSAGHPDATDVGPPTPARAGARPAAAPDGRSGMDGASLAVDAPDQSPRAIPAGARARLLTTSDNVQRRELTLANTPATVGRTDDNDIIIDHRTISKHHARIIWKNGAYTVLDLDSANGVKVNGDFRERADLHAGDEVEFGDVVTRFLDPGQKAPPLTQGRGSGGQPGPTGSGRFLAIGLGVLASIAVAWFLRSEEPPRPESTPALGPTTTEPAPSGSTDAPGMPEPIESVAVGPVEPRQPDAVTLPEGGPTATQPPGEPMVGAGGSVAPVGPSGTNAPVVSLAESPAEKAAAIVESAQRQVEEGEYADAKSLVNEALKLDPGAKGVDDLLLKIASEEKGKAQLAHAKAAVASADWHEALQTARIGLKEQPASNSATALRTIEVQATQQLRNQAVARGDGYLKQRFYKQAIASFKLALTYEPNDEWAKEGIKLAQARLKESVERPVPEPVKLDPLKPEPAKPAEGGSKIDQAKAFAQQAKAAKGTGNLPEAEKLYRQCLSTHPGMSSCRADLAVILMARGERCEAIDHMRRYTKASPGSSQAITFQRVVEQFEAQCR